MLPDGALPPQQQLLSLWSELEDDRLRRVVRQCLRDLRVHLVHLLLPRASGRARLECRQTAVEGRSSSNPENASPHMALRMRMLVRTGSCRLLPSDNSSPQGPPRRSLQRKERQQQQPRPRGSLHHISRHPPPPQPPQAPQPPRMTAARLPPPSFSCCCGRARLAACLPPVCNDLTFSSRPKACLPSAVTTTTSRELQSASLQLGECSMEIEQFGRERPFAPIG